MPDTARRPPTTSAQRPSQAESAKGRAPGQPRPESPAVSSTETPCNRNTVSSTPTGQPQTENATARPSQPKSAPSGSRQRCAPQPSQGRTVADELGGLAATPATKRPGFNAKPITLARILVTAIGGVRVADLTEDHINRAQSLYAHLSQGTVYGYNCVLRTLCRRLQAAGCERDIAAGIVRTPKQGPRVVIPSPAELATLKRCPRPTLRFVILAASECGLRFGTIAKLRPCDIADGHIRRYTKGGQIAAVPLSPSLAALLASLPAPTAEQQQARFIDLFEGQELKAYKSVLHRRWSAWKKACGITRDLRLHDLRRALARSTYETTGDIRAAQSILGHRNLSATVHYLHAYMPELSPAQLVTAIAATTKGT